MLSAKRDTSNELREGTFLKSFDICDGAYFAFPCTCATMTNCADCAEWVCAQRAIFIWE